MTLQIKHSQIYFILQNPVFALFFFTLFSLGDLHAQNTKAKSTRIRLEYFKNHDASQTLMATILAKEKSYIPLPDVTISFYSISDTSRILLDKIGSNEKGKAVLTIKDHHDIFIDSTGTFTFQAEFNGNKSCKKSQKTITIKQANLEVSFYQKDTSKFIKVDAIKIDQDQEIDPLENVGILFYIEGTFSLLNIGEEKTNENGEASMEFPVDMPGDTAGILTIVVKIEEHDDYGTIETKGEINWGKSISLDSKKHRGLGDTDAPLWMVYTLIILLSAVWFHYLYVIFLIIRIKLEEKNIKIKQLSRILE